MKPPKLPLERVYVSEEFAEGLRRIVENAKPPTDEMRAAYAKYLKTKNAEKQ